MWAQIVGKIRLSQAPLLNHWWQVTLYVSPRGLTTGAIPHRGGLFDFEAAQIFWRQLTQADRVMGEFRSHFVGKVSPVHFFWGAMDLACTRFSGREAPAHPGGAPDCGDWVTGGTGSAWRTTRTGGRSIKPASSDDRRDS
jgi:hypothetical protein